MRIKKYAFLFLLLAVTMSFIATAHVADQPSIYDTVAAVQQRLAGKYPLDALNKIGPAEVLAELSAEEREILGTALIRFTVSAPVQVYVLHDKKFTETEPLEPFWLEEQGFRKTDLEVYRGTDIFIAYEKEFPAGPIGLGVNSFSGSNQQYFVALKPVSDATAPIVTDFYPGYITVAALEVGVQPYPHPAWGPLTAVPDALKGIPMLQVDPDWRRATRIIGVYTETQFPATSRPDQILLTWSDDPQTTQTIQWRTSTETTVGAVAYMKQADHNHFQPATPRITEAESVLLETVRVVNEPKIYRHTATLRDLEPGTTYVYAVGDGTEDGWTALAEFTTAPDDVEPFSFIYMGDVQNGFAHWRSLVTRAYRERPDAAFYLLAGDNVNRGNDRDDWDDFFYNARGIFDRRTVVPALGNHEYHSGPPALYHALLTLRENGPESIPAERAYSFEYSNALFVILDSNLSPEDQADWLDATLENSSATWKFVAFHHPIYSSSPRRDNPWLRDAWQPIFDKHHVDMVLQGHDHAYLRTYPMKNDQRVDSPAEGTVYLVTVSGTKMYDQAEREYTEVGYVNMSTYQVLDIQLHGNRLVYRAYDTDGNKVDELVIEK